MSSQAMTSRRIARARAYRVRHLALASRIDAVLTAVADRLPMCGHGKRHNWSVQFADLFFPGDGCGCCWFWRGITVGAAVGFVVALLAMWWAGRPTIFADIVAGATVVGLAFSAWATHTAINVASNIARLMNLGDYDGL